MSLKSLSIKKDFYPLLHIATPLMLDRIAQSSIGFFETIFLAHLGPKVLAAGALVSWLFGTLVVILFGTLSSINILVAEKYGAKDHEGIAFVIRDGLVLAVLLMVPTSFLVWYAPYLFTLLGQDPSIAPLAAAYLHPLAWAMPPTFLMMVFLEFLVGLGHTRVIMVFTLLSVPLTILFSYLLIFGKWGLPYLQIAGAGWGILIGNTITAIALIIFVLSHNVYKNYFTHCFNFNKPSFVWELLRVGVPMGFMYCLEVGFFFTMMLIMGSINIPSLAANQIVFQYFGTLMCVAFAIAQAITVRMGHEIGAKNINAAKRASDAGNMIIISLMLLGAVCYWCFPTMLISVDLNIHDVKNDEIIRYAIPFFAIAAVYQIFEATRISLFGALRALRDTNFTVLTSAICFWGIALPLGYFLAIKCHVGGAGLWWGMVAGGAVSAVLLYQRFTFKIQLQSSREEIIEV